jgi:hypothetical protein
MSQNNDIVDEHIKVRLPTLEQLKKAIDSLLTAQLNHKLFIRNK